MPEDGYFVCADIDSSGSYFPEYLSILTPAATKSRILSIGNAISNAPIYIADDGLWHKNAANNSALFYPLKKGQTLTIKANSEHMAIFALLKRFLYSPIYEPNVGESDVMFIDGESARRTVNVGETFTYTATEDCILYVFGDDSGDAQSFTSYFPKSIYIN